MLTLVQNLKEAAISTPTAQMDSSMLSITFLKKSNAIKLVLANGVTLQAFLNDSAFSITSIGDSRNAKTGLKTSY